MSNITIQDVTIQGFGQNYMPNFVTPITGTGHGIAIAATDPLGRGGYDTIIIGRGQAGTGCDISYTTRAAIELTGLTANTYNQGGPNPIVLSHVRIDHVDAHNIVTPSANTPSGTGVGNGIILFFVEDGVVEKCRAYNNGNSAFPDTGIAFGSYWCNHILFQYNEADHNHTSPGGDEGGFDLDRFTTNSIVQFNYSHDNDGWGYMLGGKDITQQMVENNVVRFNISMNDSRGRDRSAYVRYGALLWEEWTPSNVLVYNNTLIMKSNGATDDDSRAPAIRFEARDTGNPPREGPTIRVYNNIFFADSATTTPVVNVDKTKPGFNNRDLQFLGNDYYSGQRTVIWIKWLQQTFRTVLAFRSAGPLMQETYNGQPVGTTADPRLGFDFGNAPTVTNIDSI